MVGLWRASATGGVVGVLLLTACAERQRATRGVEISVDTVAGVPVTTSRVSSAADVPRFTLRELWRAGDTTPSAGEEFAGPFIALAIGPGGRVAVLDQALSTISVLDGATGAVQERIARPGRGPGELGGPVAVAWDSTGQLWVEDQMNRRYSVYNATGDFVATIPRPSASASRRVFPIVPADGRVLDHDVLGSNLRVFTADSSGSMRDTLRIERPPQDRLTGGPIPPGSAVQQVVSLRPSLRWTFARDGRSVWVARSDSLTLHQLALSGDTLRRAVATHRTAAFTPAQEDAIRRANQELGRNATFTPVLIQAIFAMDDGRVLAQIGSEPSTPGDEFDVFASDGRLLGTLRAHIAIHPRSELDSRGDTLVVHAVGALDVPYIVKAVIEPVDQRR